MTDIDLDGILREPIYAFDFQFMVGDIADFLDFSESNLDWQYRRELLSIEQRAKEGAFPPGYTEHLATNAEYRFKVTLPLRVRYAALVALTTSVEWSTKFLVGHLRTPLDKKRRGGNEIVHFLQQMEQRVQTNGSDVIEDYAALVHVRNCIAHNAGIEKGYKRGSELLNAIDCRFRRCRATVPIHAGPSFRSMAAGVTR